MADRGRPSSYSQEIGEEICEALILSDFGLEHVCEANDKFPAARTVFRWLAHPDRDDFRQQYARAKSLQGHVQAGRGMADALTATDAQLGRLKLDARKWAASKLAPKEYGDKLDIEHSGHVTMTPEARKAEIARLIEKRDGAE